MSVLRWVVTLAVGLPLAGCGLLAATVLPPVLRLHRAAKALPDERAAARREGLALEPADLRPVPPVADRDNAGLLLQQAHALLEAIPKAQREDRALDAVTKVNPTRQQRQAARATLQRSAALLALAEAAAARPHCDFHRDWAKGPYVTMPEFASVRYLARLLAARASLASGDGDPETALDDVARIARIGSLLYEEPTIISALVGMACQQIAHRSLLELLRRHGHRADIVAKANAILPAFGPLPDLAHALHGEVVMATATVRQLRTGKMSVPELGSLVGGSAPPDPAPNPSFTPPQFILDANETQLLRHGRRIFEALRHANNDVLAAEPELAKLGHAESVENWLLAVLAPDLEATTGKFLSAQALDLLRATTIALLEERHRRGVFPVTFPTPIDPLSGKPLGYRKQGDGFILWSVGTDRKDDGGIEKTPDGKTTLDLVVRF